MVVKKISVSSIVENQQCLTKLSHNTFETWNLDGYLKVTYYSAR